MGPEGCFPLITFSDLDKVVHMLEVYILAFHGASNKSVMSGDG